MKLRWLDDLHLLYSFIQDYQRYLVDLNKGEFFPVDEVIWDILQLCPVSTLDSLLHALESRYSEQTIFEGLKKISRLAQMGYLVEGGITKLVEQDRNKSKRIFWMRHFIYPYLPPQSASVVWSNCQLIRALARYADIYLGVPKGFEDHFNFVEERIQKVPTYNDKSYSPLRYVMEEDYDGILALSIGYGDDLPFFYAPCPVLARANSVMVDVERNINGILAKYGLLRKQDVLIADASWVVEGYAHILGNSEGFEVIPDGIDEIEIPQWEEPITQIGIRPDYVKTFLAEQFRWTELDCRPIVGLIFGTHMEDCIPIALQLSHRYPKWNFLMIGETPFPPISQLPENLQFFLSFQLGKDPDAKVINSILKSIDVLFFNAVLGSSPSWLWRAMAAGIPLVITSYTPVPETDSASRFVPVERLGRYCTRVPIDKVMLEIEDLLSNPQLRTDLSVAGHNASQAFTWNKSAEQFLFILDKLNQIQSELQSPQTDVHFKSLFVRRYDKGKSRTSSQALRLPSKTPESLEKGLTRELLTWHNDKEIKGILIELKKGRKIG